MMETIPDQLESCRYDVISSLKITLPKTTAENFGFLADDHNE
jgi:hypothetical protein